MNNDSSGAGFVAVGGDGSRSSSSASSSGRSDCVIACVVCGLPTPTTSPIPSGSNGNGRSYATSIVLPSSKRTISDRVSEILVDVDVHVNVECFADAVLCHKCYSIVSKVDSLEQVVQLSKTQLRQSYANRPRRPEHQGDTMNSYGQITSIYEAGVLNYHVEKTEPKQSEDGSSSSSSGDGGEFIISQQHQQQQQQQQQPQPLTQNQQIQVQAQPQQQATQTGMRFIAAANAGFFTMNGIPQFANAVQVTEGGTHQFLLNQQCLPISLTTVTADGRNGETTAVAVGEGGACFQVPLQRAFFRTAPVTSPGPSSSASGGHVDNSSPDGSISDFPVMPKTEIQSDNDSDVSANYHHVTIQQQPPPQHHHSSLPVHPSNVGHMEAGVHDFTGSIVVKQDVDDSDAVGAKPKGARGRRRGRGQGRGGVRGGRGPNVNFNVPGAKYPCEACGHPFKTKQGLSLHRWRLHRIKDKLLKLFPCEHCGKDFNALSKLRDHKLIHTGEKPHGCPYCEYRCALFGNLNHHIRKVHKSKPALISQAAAAGTGNTVVRDEIGPALPAGVTIGINDSSGDHSMHQRESPVDHGELDMSGSMSRESNEEDVTNDSIGIKHEEEDEEDEEEDHDGEMEHHHDYQHLQDMEEHEEEDDDDDVPSPRTMLGMAPARNE